MRKFFTFLSILLMSLGLWAQAPQGLTAKMDGKGVRLTWRSGSSQSGERYCDNLESLTPGDIGGIDVRKADDYDPESNRHMIVTCDTGRIGPYLVIDNDHLATDPPTWAAASGVPNLTQGGACQVINTNKYDNSNSTVVCAHSGATFLSFWASDPKNDDYLILPELNTADKHISLWAKAMSYKYGVERFSIAVSKTGTDRTDFEDYTTVTNIPANYNTSPEGGYTFYEFDLPADTKYAAIHYDNDFCLAVFIDDLSYTSVKNTTGYNVYRDGTLLTPTPILATEFKDETVEPGKHIYTVAAVTADGEKMSESIEVVYSKEEIVDDIPEGATLSMYSHSAFGYYFMSGMVCYEPDDAGYATPVARTADGDVYLKNPITQLKSNTWLRGHVVDNGTKVAFDLPQLIYRQGDKDFYAYRMVYKENGTNKTYVADPETQTLTFDINPESGDFTLVESDKDALLGMMSSGKWTGYGDKNIVFNQVKDTPLTMPAGVEQQDWQLNYNNVGGRKVKLAIDGDKVYIQGIDDKLPESCVVGHLNGNQLSVEGSQYLGIDQDNYHSYLVPALAHKTWSTVQEDWVDVPIVLGKMTFDVDMDAKRMEPLMGDSALWVLNPVPDRITMRGRSLRNPILVVPQSARPDALPGKPIITDWVNDFTEYGFSSIKFILPLLDEDNNTIDKDHLYFRLWTNGAPLTLSPTEYKYISEETDKLPYGHFDNLDFYFYDASQEHLAFVYGQDGLKVGVQAVRVDENGQEYGSPVAWVDEFLGVDSPREEEAVTEQYYDLMGRQLSSKPQYGLFIKRTTTAQGHVSARKIIAK